MRRISWRQPNVVRGHVIAGKVSADPFPQMLGLADVDRHVIDAVEEINARRIGDVAQRVRLQVGGSDGGTQQARTAAVTVLADCSVAAFCTNAAVASVSPIAR